MTALRIALVTALLSLPAVAAADVLPPEDAATAEDAGGSAGTDAGTAEPDDGGCAIGVAGAPLGAAIPLAAATALLFARRRARR